MPVRFVRRVSAPVSAETLFDLSLDIDLHVRSKSGGRGGDIGAHLVGQDGDVTGAALR